MVAGIGGYGNSFGVPTVGGATGFHAGYNGNILVNAMAFGIARADRDFYADRDGRREPDRLSRIKDRARRHPWRNHGIGRLREGRARKSARPCRSAIPFAEKLLLEACLELMATDAVIAIQDMGAAGLTCSAVEMGAKGDLGVDLDLDAVPCREAGMTAYEMMLSESQERMLMVLRIPRRKAVAEAIFRKWGLDFAVDRPHHRHAALRGEA